VIRQTWSVQMLTIHDPEKALASLPSPLLAADTLYLSREPDLQTVKLTAGLHRQTWVNGALIFIDVHICNNTPKTIKKIEVQLEKTTLWYTHPPVGTSERTVHYLRLPRRTDTEIVSGTTVKKSSTWSGIGSYSSDVRTVELEAPRGHVTISTGRYFEIRYFVNVVVSVKMFKTVAVQLPVTIIPINSLDILPNSLAQVAASIEAERAKTVPVGADSQARASFQQGQAFSAPVRQSLEKARQSRAKLQSRDVDSLTQDLDSSPRRFGHIHSHSHCVGGLNAGTLDENTAPARASIASCSHHHLTRHPSCYHCHLLHEKDKSPKLDGPRLPRLQVSTSGLGFSESEFEVPADSPPRKVMLSEHERNMLLQLKELRTRHQRNVRKGRKPSQDPAGAQDGRSSKEQTSWNNVVVDAETGPKQAEYGNLSPVAKTRKQSVKINDPALQLTSSNTGNGTRSRSKTNPEALATLPEPSKPRRRSSTPHHDRGIKSMDGIGHSRMYSRASKEVGYRTSLDHLL